MDETGYYGANEPGLAGGFRISCYILASLYCAMFVWSSWKLLVFTSISWTWTGQKTIHLCTAAAAAGASQHRTMIHWAYRHIFHSGTYANLGSTLGKSSSEVQSARASFS